MASRKGGNCYELKFSKTAAFLWEDKQTKVNTIDIGLIKVLTDRKIQTN